jgi:hypothetical protein
MHTLHQWQLYGQIQSVSGMHVALLMFRAERSRAYLPRPNNTFLDSAEDIMLLGSKCGGVDFSLCAKLKLYWVDKLYSLAAVSITSIFKLRCLILLIRLSDIKANELAATKIVAGGRVDNSIHHFRIWAGNTRINDAACKTLDCTLRK